MRIVGKKVTKKMAKNCLSKLTVIRNTCFEIDPDMKSILWVHFFTVNCPIVADPVKSKFVKNQKHFSLAQEMLIFICLSVWLSSPSLSAAFNLQLYGLDLQAAFFAPLSALSESEPKILRLVIEHILNDTGLKVARRLSFPSRKISKAQESSPKG